MKAPYVSEAVAMPGYSCRTTEEFQGPLGKRGEDLIIVWDVQNVRIPNELEPADVLKFLYDGFIIGPGPRRCCGCYCTFTDSTKRAIGEKRFNQFTSNGVLNVMMLNVPGGPRKADDPDHPLKEVMLNFTVDCVRAQKEGVILLITGDADFVRPAVWCKSQGCVRLEVLYYGPCASRDIKNMYCSWSMEWKLFLELMNKEKCNWTFPYDSPAQASPYSSLMDESEPNATGHNLGSVHTPMHRPPRHAALPITGCGALNPTTPKPHARGPITLIPSQVHTLNAVALDMAGSPPTPGSSPPAAMSHLVRPTCHGPGVSTPDYTRAEDTQNSQGGRRRHGGKKAGQLLPASHASQGKTYQPRSGPHSHTGSSTAYATSGSSCTAALDAVRAGHHAGTASLPPTHPGRHSIGTLHPGAPAFAPAIIPACPSQGLTGVHNPDAFDSSSDALKPVEAAVTAVACVGSGLLDAPDSGDGAGTAGEGAAGPATPDISCEEAASVASETSPPQLWEDDTSFIGGPQPVEGPVAVVQLVGEQAGLVAVVSTQQPPPSAGVSPNVAGVLGCQTCTADGAGEVAEPTSTPLSPPAPAGMAADMGSPTDDPILPGPCCRPSADVHDQGRTDPEVSIDELVPEVGADADALALSLLAGARPEMGADTHKSGAYLATDNCKLGACPEAGADNCKPDTCPEEGADSHNPGETIVFVPQPDSSHLSGTPAGCQAVALSHSTDAAKHASPGRSSFNLAAVLSRFEQSAATQPADDHAAGSSATAQSADHIMSYRTLAQPQLPAILDVGSTAQTSRRDGPQMALNAASLLTPAMCLQLAAAHVCDVRGTCANVRQLDAAAEVACTRLAADMEAEEVIVWGNCANV